MGKHYINVIQEEGFFYYEHQYTSRSETEKDNYLKGKIGLVSFVWHVFRTTSEYRKTSFDECLKWAKTLQAKTVKPVSLLIEKQIEPINENMKRCSKCGEIKPKTEFGKCSKEKDGLVYQCKNCRNEYERKKDHARKAIKRLEKEVDSTSENSIEATIQENNKIKKMLFPNTIIPKRKYYIHKRKMGTYYVEFINQVTGKKMSAKSTGKHTKEEAIEIVESWLKNGIPPKYRMNISHAHEQTVDAIILALMDVKLTKKDVARIAAYLTKDFMTIDLEYLIEKNEELKAIYNKEKDNYRTLKHNAKAFFTRHNNINPSVTDETLKYNHERLVGIRKQLLYLERRIKKIKQGDKNGKREIERSDECG